MEKSTSKRLANKFNQIDTIYCHVEENHPKKPPKPSAKKTEAMKINSITDQLDD